MASDRQSVLDKSFERMTIPKMMKVVEMVQSNPSITELNLQSCGIGINQINVLAGNWSHGYVGLKDNQTLRKLDLRWNPISLTGAKAVLKLVKTTNLIDVKLTNNPNHDDFGDGNYESILDQIQLELLRNQSKTRVPLVRQLPDLVGPMTSPKVSPIEKKQEPNSTVSTIVASVSSVVVKPLNGAKQFLGSLLKESPTIEDVKTLKLTVEQNQSALKDLHDLVQVEHKRLNEHDEKFSRLEKIIKKESLQVLNDNIGSLSRLIVRESKIQANDSERKFILDNPLLSEYYLAVMRHFTGTWLACMTISSGCVANGMQFNSDYVSKALTGIGGLMPGVNIATAIIAGIIEANNTIDKNKLVANMAQFFSDFETATHIIKSVALILTQKQQELIIQSNVPASGKKAQLKKWFNEAKNWALSDGSNKPAIVLALADCGKILEAIMEGTLKKTENIAEIIKIVIQEKLEVTHSVDSTPVQVVTFASMSSNATMVSSHSRRRSSSFSKFKEEMLRQIAAANARAERAEQKSEQAERRAKQAEQDSEQSKLASREALSKAQKLEDQNNQASGGTQMLAFMPRSRPRGTTLFGDENIFSLAPRLNQLAREVEVTTEWMQQIQSEMTTVTTKRRGKKS